MKESIISLLQQRMDKCTSEQHWMVAALTGLNAFIIVQRDSIMFLPSAVIFIILAIITVATIYGVWFIIHRHRSYYFYRAELSKLLQDEKDVPDFLKTCPKRKISSLSGVVFYVGSIIALWLASLIAL